MKQLFREPSVGCSPYVKFISCVPLKFIVEKHSDGYIAYPLGLKGVALGQGDTYDQTLADAKSATKFHIETLGGDAFDEADDVEAAYVAEGNLAVG